MPHAPEQRLDREDNCEPAEVDIIGEGKPSARVLPTTGTASICSIYVDLCAQRRMRGEPRVQAVR